MPLSALPPLHFLHAVEAAARLGSFRAAAAELHLTPSAVSQQIRAVEESLGTPLFIRKGRAVVLTSEGQPYCQDVRRILHELRDAGTRLNSRSNAHVVRLSTVDFLAPEFLIPRLPLFQRRFPRVELRIETSMRVVELHASEVDAALRVRGTVGARLSSEPVGPVTATVVASPEVAGRLKTFGDLCAETLLEMGGGARGSWGPVMQRAGYGDRKLRMLEFESYFQALIAAERGLGVAFGLFPMTTEWVERDRLAVPFDMRSPIEGGVYLAFRTQDRRRPLFGEIAAFLREQYAELPALPAGRIDVALRARSSVPRTSSRRPSRS